MIYDEAKLAVERTNANFINIAVVVQAATATTGMGAGDKATSHFKKLIKSLSGE